ncbi:hypothetical protein SGUI_2202 [Serinicoccus hydrothermalis]|uniref:Integral membrane protein n=1 Tax=Serinicoccus hydrothermalis TaxID=1758689 RepID=A0A1B1NDS3_9MICO|nr:hypothetical protein SGUI_2202 [Serinicoccus hydrothermalis]
MVETALVLLLVLTLHDHRVLALLVLGASSFVFVLYLLLDVIASARGGTAAGDASAMWRLSVPATLAALVSVSFLRVISLVHLL